MERTYVQLSLEDRCEISRRFEEGQSIRKIAADMDRAPSTIARELKLNTGRKVGYEPAYANEQTKARRWKGSKLAPSLCRPLPIQQSECTIIGRASKCLKNKSPQCGHL